MCGVCVCVCDKMGVVWLLYGGSGPAHSALAAAPEGAGFRVELRYSGGYGGANGSMGPLPTDTYSTSEHPTNT